MVWLPLEELHPFKGYPALRGIMPRNQPYQVRDDDPSMLQIAATVKARGVRQPGLVRPDPEGGYEIIAGERRRRASELAGLRFIFMRQNMSYSVVVRLRLQPNAGDICKDSAPSFLPGRQFIKS